MTGNRFKPTALFLTASLLAAPGLASDSGVYIDIRESEAADARVVERLKLYGASHALVIGIDDYVGGWPKLNNAVRDARKLADELERHGFQVTLKTDPDGHELRETLRAFYALQGADPNARLLLWFAGHGHTIDDEGFLVPADAPPASDPLFKVKALHMRDFEGFVRLAEAKHVLSIFDSCFSGTIFTARSGATLSNLTHKTKKPVRQFITSGDANQQVRDDGSFRELFLRALRGEERADANADGYVTGEELGLYLSQRMTNLTDAAQTPRYGRLQDVNFDQGDFVFQLPGGAVQSVQPTQEAAQPAPARSSKDEMELAFWESIKESGEAADYRAYLESFPSGTFAPLARARLARLQEEVPQVTAEVGTRSQGGSASGQQQAALPQPADPEVESVWETRYGTMEFFLKLRPNGVGARYGNDNGRLIVEEVSDGHMRGIWLENASKKPCTTAVLGSKHWGRFDFDFSGANAQFAGRWGYCNDPLNATWHGHMVSAR